MAAGLLYYVAQSFLPAGSIFGLDQYIRIIKKGTKVPDPFVPFFEKKLRKCLVVSNIFCTFVTSMRQAGAMHPE